MSRSVGSCLLAGLSLLAGCGMELVRPSAEPAAVELRPVATPVEAGVVCRMDLDSVALPPAVAPPAPAPSFGLMGGAGIPIVTAGAPEDPSVTAETLAAFVAAMGEARVFRGGVLAPGSEEAGKAVVCEARLRVTRVSEPEIIDGTRHVLIFVCVVALPIGIPLSFLWLELEPELVERYVLDVAVPGEEGAHYEVIVRGTIEAQLYGNERKALPRARVTLRDLAIKSLISRFADDQAAQARLREQLDDGPALELEPLLVGEELNAPRARWRTRKLIGWKNESLAARTSESKTSELRALIGRLETCMLDLTHESEVEKDSAQAFTAKGSEGEARVARELSLAYRERVEVLRPILTAFKDELEGRSR